MQPNSFTLKSQTGLLRSIISDCGVCIAYNPMSGNPHPNIHNYKALWDTGATNTVISKNVINALALKPIGQTKVFHAKGDAISNVYAINLFLPNQVAFSFVKVTEGDLNGFDILIGMDIITAGDFSVTNVGGKTTFSFRIPSSKEIDYMQERVITEPLKAEPKLGRNDPCHCGSGKKFKHCHGKSA